MIGIVDYGIGNIHSLTSAFIREGYDVQLTANYFELKKAEIVILPGVGAFKYAMSELKRKRMIDTINELRSQNKVIVGICLGMQLLYEKGYEHGECDGLGYLKGDVEMLPDTIKIPHMGWNSLTLDQSDSPLLKGIDKDAYVYFVHSYFANNIDKGTLVASTDYGVKVPAIVQDKNIIGFQFHPEKSGFVGAKLIANLKEVL